MASPELTPLRSVLGVGLFFAGWGCNVWSDEILRALRKPGETGYKIPHGALFGYVTASNYFAELIEVGKGEGTAALFVHLVLNIHSC